MVYELEIPLKNFQDLDQAYLKGALEPILVQYKINRKLTPYVDITEIYCQHTGQYIPSNTLSDVDNSTIIEACMEAWEETLNEKEYDNDDDVRGSL